MDELKDYNVIHYPTMPIVQTNGELVSVNSRFTINDMAVIATTALNHLGIALVPLPLVAEEVRQGLLVPILLDYPLASRDFYLVYPSRRQLAAKTIVFVDHMIEQVQNMDYWNVSVVEYLEYLRKSA